MVNGILLEDNAYANVTIRDSIFIGGSGTDENYTFVYGNDSTLTISGLITGDDLSSNRSDSDGSSGSFDGNPELILILLVLSVCIILVCFFLIIRLMKTKNEQSKNVQREFGENMPQNLSDAEGTSGNHERDQSGKGNVNGGEVEIQQVNVATIAELKPLSSNSLGLSSENDNVDIVLNDHETEFANGAHTSGLSVSEQENDSEQEHDYNHD